jgi:hypothetical protein
MFTMEWEAILCFSYLPSALYLQESSTNLLDFQIWIWIDHLDNICFWIAERFPDTGEMNIAFIEFGGEQMIEVST